MYSPKEVPKIAFEEGHYSKKNKRGKIILLLSTSIRFTLVMKIPFAGHMKRAHLMLTVLSRMETQLATYFMRKTDVKSVIAYYMLKWLL